MTPKAWHNAAEALPDTIRDGMILAIGGFGLSGIPRDPVFADDLQVDDFAAGAESRPEASQTVGVRA